MICSEDMQQGCAMANVTFKYSENAAVGHSDAVQSCEPASLQFEVIICLETDVLCSVVQCNGIQQRYSVIMCGKPVH